MEGILFLWLLQYASWIGAQGTKSNVFEVTRLRSVMLPLAFTHHHYSYTATVLIMLDCLLV